VPDVLERDLDPEATVRSASPPSSVPPAVGPAIEVDERAARESLREQISRLESELGALFCSAFPREGFEWKAGTGAAGPRLLTLEQLEKVRDDLVERLHANRRMMTDQTAREDLARRRIEEMLLEPERFKWHRISNEDIGETGCKHWHVVPRLGPIGMMMGWWRVKISSGCPLAGGRGPRP
jgi:hypothetical protein